MKITRRRIRAKFNQVATFTIRKMRKRLPWNPVCGCLTIFHDYESIYALSGNKESSYYGVTKLLDIEKKYNIKVTYNVVGRLFEDYPEIISRIIEEGHDISSHSYNHDVMTSLSREQINKDIKQSKSSFNQFNIPLNGFRSPQSRWSFNLMRSILNNGLGWSAENDKADFPYTILKKGNKSLIRFPIKMDDWEYISNNISPSEMYKKLIDTVDKIEQKKCYGAIGFHPWVQGENRNRIEVFEEFIKYVSSLSNLNVMSFQQIYAQIFNFKN
jgi:peptidoglycan/xylan/chitin deacetylase (PgdA/CDA1 family)